MTEKLIDHEIREEVVSGLDCNYNVVAGAGTGKTTLLVDRILHYILRSKGLSVREIVALTFTEKAANEMKMRLISELEKLQNGESDGVFRKSYGLKADDIEQISSTALQDIHKAQICTIHSFCANILRLYPLEAGLPPDFAVDEGNNFDDLFAKKWPLWLQSELSLASAGKDKWLVILKKFNLDEIKKIAGMMCDGTLPESPLVTGGSMDYFRAKLKKQADELELVRRTVEARIAPGSPDGENIYEILRNLRGAYENAARLKLPAEELPKFNALRSIKNFSKEEVDGLRMTLKNGRDYMQDEIVPMLRQIDDETIKSLLELIKPFAMRFKSWFISAGFVSFNGLLERARDLLKNNKAVRSALKAECKRLLVDEFQDTDPIQCEIVLFLSEQSGSSANSADDVKLDPGKLFIVGDPKQSIYFFRRADIESYMNVQEKIEVQGGKKEFLKTNFRSHSGIVDVINDLFVKIITKKENYQQEYHSISARRGPTLPFQDVQLVLVRNEGTEAESKVGANEARIAEAEWIARWIKENIGKPKTSDGLKLSYQDIAILMRSLNPVKVYIEALKRHDIKYIVEGEKFFYNMQEVIDFSNLLKAVDNPTDAFSLAGYLRSPYAGLKESEIAALFNAKAVDYRRPDEIPRPLERNGLVRKIYGTLLELNLLSKRLPLGDFFSVLFKKTFVLEMTAGLYYGEQCLANILKLHQKALNDSANPGITLNRYISALDKAIETVPEEGESPLADETFNAVRIFSIHKSKGLEFPVIMLPNLHGDIKKAKDLNSSMFFDWRTNKFGFCNKNICNSNFIELDEMREDRLDAEDRRVLYVAMTRAREKLILLSNAGVPGGSFGQMLGGVSGMDFNSIESGRHETGKGFISIEKIKYDPDEIELPVKRKAASKTRYDLTKHCKVWAGRKNIRDAACARPLFTSPTGLSDSSGFSAKNATQADTLAMLKGIIMHRAMEQHDFTAGIGDLHSIIKRIVSEQYDGLPERDKDALIAFANEKLSGFAKSGEYAELVSAEILGRETPFIVKHGAQIVSGVIDIIYRTKKGVIVVADYKTGTAAEPKELDKTNRMQKEIYLRVVKESLKMPKAEFRWIII
ncbi:MAG: UvrD-helicase domain-containing protein [Planctomycetes bacterium]|nr:UvrD-helicase domain-containing protein [Planctomycetota bacterium]